MFRPKLALVGLMVFCVTCLTLPVFGQTADPTPAQLQQIQTDVTALGTATAADQAAVAQIGTDNAAVAAAQATLTTDTTAHRPRPRP